MSLRYSCEEKGETKTRKRAGGAASRGARRDNWFDSMAGKPRERRGSTGLTTAAHCQGQDQEEATDIDKWGIIWKLGQSQSMGWVEARLWEVMEAS